MSMAAMPCTCCGRVLEYTEEHAVVTCPGCATRNIAPRVTGETLLTLQRATEQRLAADFHNAELSYQQVLLYRPDAHEALWGRLLCHYGVEYVEDPATHRRMPTVHTVQARPLQAQPDYIKACRLAPDVIRAQYELDAAYIDDAQADIRQRAKACPPYDVFLCHKTTKIGSTEKTEDFQYAQDVYHALDKQGVRVFFAPKSLTDVAGANYEAGIYHALHTAKVMLLFCTHADYLTSPWVRSEWTRFLNLIEEDEATGGESERKIIPLFFDHFNAYDLPQQFLYRSTQGIDMTSFGASQKVLDIVTAAVKPVAKEEPEPVPEPVVENETERKPVVEDTSEPKPVPDPKPGPKAVTVEFPNPHPMVPAIQKLALMVAAKQYQSVQWGETVTVPAEYSTKFTVAQEFTDKEKKAIRITSGVLAAIAVVIGLISNGHLGGGEFICIGVITPIFCLAFGIGFSNNKTKIKSFMVAPGRRYRVYWRKSILGGYTLDVEE